MTQFVSRYDNYKDLFDNAKINAHGSVPDKVLFKPDGSDKWFTVYSEDLSREELEANIIASGNHVSGELRVRAKN